jgi:chromosome segregation ATPase
MSVPLFTTSASGQSSATGPNSTDKPIVATQGSQVGSADNRASASEPKPGTAKNKVAADAPKSNDLKDEIDAVKAENAAVREVLRKMEEQQKLLLEQVDRLQRRLDGSTTADALAAGQPVVSPTT